MSESYSESNAVPEQTLSAVADATVEIFDKDDYVADQGPSPGDISPDQLETNKALADVTSKVRDTGIRPRGFHFLP